MTEFNIQKLYSKTFKWTKTP